MPKIIINNLEHPGLYSRGWQENEINWDLLGAKTSAGKVCDCLKGGVHFQFLTNYYQANIQFGSQGDVITNSIGEHFMCIKDVGGGFSNPHRYVPPYIISNEEAWSGSPVYWHIEGGINGTNLWDLGGDQWSGHWIRCFGEKTVSYPGEYFIPPATISYNETTSRWETFYSFFPDIATSSSEGLITFYNGDLYMHQEEQAKNIFYQGQQQLQYGVATVDDPEGVFKNIDQPYSEVHIISNKEPGQPKIYNSISLESSTEWEPYELTTPKNQITTLTDSNFKKKEGHYYSAIYNDINSPGGRINGDKMRGTSLLVKIKNFSRELIKIFTINFLYKNSPRHGR